MTRPEGVRCENCCYVDIASEDTIRGGADARNWCSRNHPREREVALIAFCGEFRKEWPVRILDGNNPEHESEIESMRVKKDETPEQTLEAFKKIVRES